MVLPPFDTVASFSPFSPILIESSPDVKEKKQALGKIF